MPRSRARLRPEVLRRLVLGLQAGGAARCESPVERGDTYGPVIYSPTCRRGGARLDRAAGTTCRRRTGRRCSSTRWRRRARVRGLPARRRPPRRALAVLLGDVPVHRLRDVVELERHDHRRVPGLGDRAVLVPACAASCSGSAPWAKFAPLLLVPLCCAPAAGPRPSRPSGPTTRAGPPLLPRPGALAAAAASGSARAAGGGRFLLGLGTARWSRSACSWCSTGRRRSHVLDRTFGWQLDRPSPFSIWDWGEYPGFPTWPCRRRC